MYERYGGDYDWFIKTDDDTFLWMSHLMGYLNAYNPADKMFIGYIIKSASPIKWVGGGAGYVFSRATLQEVVRKNDWHWDFWRPEHWPNKTLHLTTSTGHVPRSICCDLR